MNVRSLDLAAVGLGLSLAAPALAQDTMKYDPIMEKRADLRLKWIRANQEARSQEEPTLRMHRTMQDRSRMVDFLSLMSKRADLQDAVSRDGLEAAYADWLARQRGEKPSELKMHRVSREETKEEAARGEMNRARMVDFMSLLSKRADLRGRAAQIGLDAAYDEWLAKQPHK
jgi:hypothetical protein